tara:strand:+ start:41489 stop:42013 length:525 start_codon:yes stop_codon:yes gene_type:complete
MILIINICKEKLHELEFVKPIEDILKKDNLIFITKSYQNLNEQDIDNSDKIIICGTSLKDNEFLNHINDFNWIKDYNKPILGICGGMHILHLIYGGKKQDNKIIGNKKITFSKEFLGLKGDKWVYNLHQYYFDNKEFETFANNQTSKHKTKPFYGVLFHPEVRNKELIEKFVKL